MKLETIEDARRTPRPASLACAVLLAAAAGCTGSDGPQGPPGSSPETTPTELERGEDPPGIEIAITSLAGASGSGGAFRVGDTIRVTFTVKKDDGRDWDIAELSRGRTLVSGPTFNYQRVIAEQSDVHTASRRNPDGSYTYTYPVAIPATYLPPVNDSPSFGPLDGELAGQDLLSGTYTLGLYFTFAYTVEGEPFQDVGNLTMDFLFGSAMTLQPREVVTRDNCNQCHESLRAHGGQRQDVTLCLLCHTSGAEDRNVPTVEGGTPGASVDFRVMIHKIHNGKHLPSVMGMESDANGFRVYTATPRPYRLVGFGNSVHDFSKVGFPVWPSLSIPMPRDAGHSMLDPDAQAKEDLQRSGVVACDVCHGDPDGGGPLEAPAQGGLAYQQPTRRACGSCHDDIAPNYRYRANNQSMPPQPDDSACVLCHPISGFPLAVLDGHAHPLIDPAENVGLNFDLLSVDEAGTNDDDGTFDRDEKMALTFTVTDDMGVPVDPADLSTLTAVLSGPTDGMNLVEHARIPAAALSGAQPYVLNLPTAVHLEYLGDATPMADVFTTELSPHWTAAGAPTTVWERVATGGGSTLLAASSAPQNYLDVANGAVFSRNDFVVVDDGMPDEEYLLVQWVDGDRLWFASPYQTDAEPGAPAVYKYGTELDHASGATVDVVTLTELVEGMGNDYVLTPASGTIAEEGGAFGNGNAIVASYTADFVVPDRYPLTLNDSPGLDETAGEWAGKSLVDGTYRIALWGNTTLDVIRAGETTTYRAASTAVNRDVLFGNAMNVEPYDLVSSAQNCYACHQDLVFHGGGRRGLDACLQCHAVAGGEDRPRYRAEGAPDTDGVSVRFREMLHKIHHGKELAEAATYTVVGFGPGGDYPDNYSEHRYSDVGFPVMPAGTRHCAKCHGDTNDAWKVPAPADHPSEQGLPSRPWRVACGSCHDSPAARGHIEDQTSTAGLESCAVCHGPGGIEDVELVHEPRF